MVYNGIILAHVFGYPVTLFAACMLFFWIVFVWGLYLDIRQHRTVVRSTRPPPDLANLVNEEEFAKSRVYSIDKNHYSFVHDTYEMIKMTLVLYYSIIPWLWTKVTIHAPLANDFIRSKLGVDLGITGESEIVCSLLFWLYVSAFQLIESMPWSLYYTFVLEEKHGFNKQTLGFFLKDQIKKLFVSMIITFPILSLLIWIIKAGGEYFYLYAYGFSLVVTIVLMFIYPEFIAPLFDRYTPLPEGTLRQKIESLAASIGFPLKKLLVVQGSKRSAHSNAYFYGFWKNKRIVLYDTLIRGFKFPEKDGAAEPTTEEEQGSDSRGCAVDEEIVAVLGHELGHWKLGHTLINLFIGQANLLFMFVVFASLMNVDGIFHSFGFTTKVPILLRLLIIFQFIFSPYNTVLGFLMTILSRRLEFQADRFAVDLGYGSHLRAALLVLHKDNLSFLIIDWLYSLFNLSHPPLVERIRAIDAVIAKEK